MDDQGRLIIPAEFRKNAKEFIGKTFGETGVAYEKQPSQENEHEGQNRKTRRRLEVLQRRVKETAK